MPSIDLTAIEDQEVLEVLPEADALSTFSTGTTFSTTTCPLSTASSFTTFSSYG